MKEVGWLGRSHIGEDRLCPLVPGAEGWIYAGHPERPLRAVASNEARASGDPSRVGSCVLIATGQPGVCYLAEAKFRLA